MNILISGIDGMQITGHLKQNCIQFGGGGGGGKGISFYVSKDEKKNLIKAKGLWDVRLSYGRKKVWISVL